MRTRSVKAVVKSSGSESGRQSGMLSEHPIEHIMAKGHDFYMDEALKEARRAYEAGEVPVGCVIVCEGRVIARSHNQVEMLRDATAHAEMIAITQASEALGDWRLDDAVLYVTKEPCPMCAGAIVLSRLGGVVFGARDFKAGSVLSVHDIRDIETQLNAGVSLEIVADVRGDESSSLLRGFFQEKRRRKPGERTNGWKSIPRG